MIRLEGVTKTYAKSNVHAVDNIDLHVQKGEVFGFIGPNGAGKTTTIKMITGILSPTSGRVLIDNVDILRDPVSAKMKMGYAPDSSEVYDRLSGLEYLNFVADMYQVPGEERRARMEKYLTMFEIKDAIGNQIKSFSHGMKQKLTLTGALIHNPDLWIMDEPMVGLDPRSSHLLKEEMREHCQKGNTVFFSTHVLEVAERLCDRIAIINQGKIVAIGTLEDLRAGRDESLESLFLELTDKNDSAPADM
ncbi:ABC transporter ATP-binding protein [Eubacteriales bacterium OttesenSCG-928-M02]|nr:ABC transporter ATP-binding protein [Eubacteriales bacterium OttesenSCG-928-M02]